MPKLTVIIQGELMSKSTAANLLYHGFPFSAKVLSGKFPDDQRVYQFEADSDARIAFPLPSDTVAHYEETPDVSMDEALKALLLGLHDLGTSDLYTDSPEYGNRVASMEALCGLAGKAAAGEPVDLGEVNSLVTAAENDDDGEEFCAIPACFQKPEDGSDYCLIHIHHEGEEGAGKCLDCGTQCYLDESLAAVCPNCDGPKEEKQ